MKIIEINGIIKLEAEDGKELYFKSNPYEFTFREIYLGVNDSIDNYEEREILNMEEYYEL